MPLSELEVKLDIKQLRNAGTFAEVYLAEKTLSNKKPGLSAIKILKEKWSDNLEILQRFQDEATLLKNLSHPNILRVDGLIEVNGRAGILMEFIDGIDLKQLLRALRGQLPQSVAFEIGAKVADALHSAYAVKPTHLDAPLRVLHRDIKPSNIMLSATGEVKILDFGASFFLSKDRNAQTQMFQFGSQKYMPPERKSGERGSHQADTYSLGITLLEMFSESKITVFPANKADHDAMVKQHINSIKINLPSKQWENTALQTIFRMCAYDRQHRLTADQVKGMFIPFAQHSEGPSLMEFAKTHISPLARRAFPKSKGSLSGINIDTRPEKDRVSEVAPFPLPNINNELITNQTIPSLQDYSKENTDNVKESPEPQPNQSISKPINIPAFLLGIVSTSISIPIVLSVISFGLMNMSANSASEQSETIPKVTQGTSENLEPIIERFTVDLIQDEGFRYVKLLDTEDNLLLQVKTSSPNDKINLADGEYFIEFKTRPKDKQPPLTKKVVLQIKEEGSINCRIDLEEGANCYLGDLTLEEVPE